LRKNFLRILKNAFFFALKQKKQGVTPASLLRIWFLCFGISSIADSLNNNAPSDSSTSHP
jgi:hypothetical protein